MFAQHATSSNNLFNEMAYLVCWTMFNKSLKYTTPCAMLSSSNTPPLKFRGDELNPFWRHA